MSLRDLFRRSGREDTAVLSPASGASQLRGSARRSESPIRELRLAEGGRISVSDEQHYQQVLTRIRGPENSRDVVASLEVNPHGNPWGRKPTGRVIEVKVNGDTVGFLTPAMTERFGRFADAAALQGRVLTAKACVASGTGASGRDVEITLLAVPRPADQRSIVGLDVQTRPDYVVTNRGFAHVIKSEVTSGWLVECGEPIAMAAAELILTTTPWVGRVRADGSIVDGWPAWCESCRPNQTSVEDGGRFGEATSISTVNRFSAAMTVDAIKAALATRLDFDVAGESFRPGYPDTLLRFAEVLRTGRPGERLTVVLRRDPGNPYDTNAIEIHVPGEAGHVGFVPGQFACLLAPMLDAGTRIRASAVEVRIRADAPDRPGLTVSLQRVEPTQD